MEFALGESFTTGIHHLICLQRPLPPHTNQSTIAHLLEVRAEAPGINGLIRARFQTSISSLPILAASFGVVAVQI